MFRYRLRTLLIVLGIGPPLLAWGCVVGASIMAKVRAQDDEWIEVGGPGIIAEFPTSFWLIEPDEDAPPIEEPPPCSSSVSATCSG
jgi:hypothetical protein